MNFDNGPYAESDADDEYEQASTSPAAGSVASPFGMSVSSNEHTPTTYGKRNSLGGLPDTIISEWTAEDCADFISSVGLSQYADQFIENEIVGEALVALQHDDLKSMGIASVGHRLTILKSVYDVKKVQDVPVESDHYIPLSADAEAQYATATLKDIRQLVEQLRLRDERMAMVEQDIRRLAEDFRRLREDMLPALRAVKDAQQPLPSTLTGQSYPYESSLSPPAATPSTGGSASQSSTAQGHPSAGIKRQYSTKKIMLGTAPKNPSPTFPHSNHDRGGLEQTLDPASAAERAVLSSNHLNAVNGNSQNSTSPASYNSPNMPSPTSPSTAPSATLASRSYRAEPTPARSTFSEGDQSQYGGRDRPAAAPRRRDTPGPTPDTPNGGSNASVEIFKSFRVSMDDPCHKVLPAALKKYQINAPWDHYALYIVYGDQERCLGLDEKPLILFKQLDKEGKKPMFMLRKTNTAQADTGDINAMTSATGIVRPGTMGYDPPGGII